MLIRLIRPAHWIKNLIVLFPVIFAVRMYDARSWALAAVVGIAFCLASSSMYVVNDIVDRNRDRLHPSKNSRPIAAGLVKVPHAWVLAFALSVVAMAIASAMGTGVVIVVGGYLVLTLAYTFFLKSKMLLDVIALSLGFVLRAAGGALAIGVELSPWLFIVTFTICLFMGYCKRFSEIAILDQAMATNHRPTLAGYSVELLTHLVTLSAGVSIVAFLLYATSPRTVGHYGTHHLIYTLPLVIYGVTRFAMLSMKGQYSDPTELLLRDRPFQITAVLWTLMAAAVILYGQRLEHWLPAGR